jgi:hypothetical protein
MNQCDFSCFTWTPAAMNDAAATTFFLISERFPIGLASLFTVIGRLDRAIW